MSAGGEADVPEYRQELTAHPATVARIRCVVGAYMRLWGFEQFEAAAALCVDELLSNVGKHTGSLECVLLVCRRHAGVRVTVSDSSSKLPVVRETDWCAESGRGLVLLDGVADRWGVDLTAGGKDVWVEFRSRSVAGEVAR